MLSVESKDPKVQDLQLEQKHLAIAADLVAATSEAPSLVAISGVLATRSIVIDVKEVVKSVQKVHIIDKATGAIEPLLSAPVISGSTITVTADGTGLASACIEILYRN
jgi:hypothetical protein